VAGSAVTGVRARLFAPEASEFLSLSLEEARTAVAAGLAEVKRASLPTPSSFCAPAWLLPAEYKDVLRSAGLSTYVGMYSIEQLDGRGTQFTPGFGYMGGSGPHELGIRALNFLMTPAIRRADVVAVYLHPDVTGRRRWLRVTETLASLMRLGTYTAETYCGLFHSLCTGVML
jgi:predicted deacetylase